MRTKLLAALMGGLAAIAVIITLVGTVAPRPAGPSPLSLGALRQQSIMLDQPGDVSDLTLHAIPQGASLAQQQQSPSSQCWNGVAYPQWFYDPHQGRWVNSVSTTQAVGNGQVRVTLWEYWCPSWIYNNGINFSVARYDWSGTWWECGHLDMNPAQRYATGVAYQWDRLDVTIQSGTGFLSGMDQPIGFSGFTTPATLCTWQSLTTYSQPMNGSQKYLAVTAAVFSRSGSSGLIALNIPQFI